MNISENFPKKRMFVLRILVIVLIAVTVYALNDLKQAGVIYDQTSATLSKQQVIAKKVQLGDTVVAIPTYNLFKAGNVWALVSKKHPLEGEAGYTLIDIPVAHGDAGQKMQIARDISDPLQRLVNAAEADGESLMISSAYRSLAEQKQLRDAFIEKNGEDLASLYVSPVGASEHHTGLSVDFSSVSTLCSSDSDKCSLSVSGAEWLAANAAKFGFIQRYPEGDQPTTGVAFEPWHYRYVGSPLARAMAGTGLTFDEVVMQIAPGYGPKE